MRSKHVALAVLLVCTGTRAERERVWELSAPSYESVEQPLPGLVSVHSAEGRVRFVLQGSMGSMIECISKAPAALRCAKKGESAPEPNTTVEGALFLLSAVATIVGVGVGSTLYVDHMIFHR